MATFCLVSAPFACGVTWLVNVLLELGLRVTNAGFLPDHWEETGSTGEVECGPKAFDHLRWHLPVLHKRTRFTFEPSLEVLWEHRLDFVLSSGRPIILFARDPRDAIYSMYRRNYAHALPLREYLHRPDIWPDHFPGIFGLPPADTWAYFYLYWLAMGSIERVHAVRFEAMREDPVGITTQVLRFLGVERSDAAIREALEVSSFEEARQAMERTAETTGRTFVTARRGAVGEWREVYDAADLAAFAGPAQHAMAALGYELGELAAPVADSDAAAAIQRLPGVQGLLAEARAACARGALDEAEKRLASNLYHYAGHAAACLALCCDLQAVRWAQQICAAHPPSSCTGHIVRTFCALNARFVRWPGVQEQLWRLFEETTRKMPGRSVIGNEAVLATDRSPEAAGCPA